MLAFQCPGYVTAYLGRDASGTVEIYGFNLAADLAEFGQQLGGEAASHFFFSEHYRIHPKGEDLFFYFSLVEHAPVYLGTSAIGYQYHIFIYMCFLYRI